LQANRFHSYAHQFTGRDGIVRVALVSLLRDQEHSLPQRGQVMFSERIKLNRQKFEELILWIAEKAPNVGITKLEKLLYLCDFISAEKTGVPITGETYRRFAMGPVPKHFVQIMQGLEGRDLDTQEIIRNAGGTKRKPFKKIVPKRHAKDVFTSTEQEIMREVLNEFGHLDVDELLAHVHNDITCKATKHNADISYALAPYRRYKKPEKAAVEALKSDPGYLRILEAALR
jgi:hypothetical protein